MKYKNIHFEIKIFSIFVLIILILNILLLIYNRKNVKYGKRIGVISLRHEVNIGNNLIKYAISILIKQLGYKPFIIGTHWNNFNITFINKTTNLVIIKDNFSEIRRNDYDILMVNSDQTWRYFDKNFYDYGFLKFAENWNIKKFVYGASLGYDVWKFTKKEEEVAKNLIKNFSDISVREKGSIKLIKEHFGITPTLVLDPTLLIDKKYYLNIIKDYKGNKVINKKYIFAYTVLDSKIIIQRMKEASRIFKYETYFLGLNNYTTVENFLYYMINSDCVITNSFHGTIFSILFNKPFITIYANFNARERYRALGDLFGIHDRIFENRQKPNLKQLINPLKIDLTSLNQLKLQSINFLKKNLENI